MFRSFVAYLRQHHVGLLALLVALGGTAYAAESINGRDIVDGSIKGKDIKNGTLKGRDLKPDSLTGVNIDESTLNDSLLGATVLGPDLEFAGNDGFDSVVRTDVGTYDLKPSDPDAIQTCSFGTSFAGLTKAETAGGGAIGVVYEPESVMRVVIRDPAGEPIDIGNPGSPGPAGFSIVAAC